VTSSTPIGPHFGGWSTPRNSASVSAGPRRGSASPSTRRSGDDHVRRRELTKIAGVAAFVGPAVLALLPPWPLLVTVVAGAVVVSRTGFGPVRDAARAAGRILVRDGRTPEQTAGAARGTHRPAGVPTGMDLGSWLRGAGQRGRMPSPAHVRRDFPQADPVWLAAYERDYAVYRRERIREHRITATGSVGERALWVCGQAVDADGSRRGLRDVSADNDRRAGIDRHRHEASEFFRRADTTARRRGRGG
jgi:hypothetical protein